jgi:hypothetical protein
MIIMMIIMMMVIIEELYQLVFIIRIVYCILLYCIVLLYMPLSPQHSA